MFKLNFETSSGAFSRDPESEVVRILREIADSIENRRFVNDVVRDIDGETIGEVSVRY
ncbi:hypothetical protein [Mycolicibacterium conceptionense]|uniref:hypothetical protein n=1 Tax=Mycolicibacterium conceptionense TaxID=451644 RepID=UPI000A518853|nr:hypothetical protein [Mycolicibacterium conceptionense]